MCGATRRNAQNYLAINATSCNGTRNIKMKYSLSVAERTSPQCFCTVTFWIVSKNLWLAAVGCPSPLKVLIMVSA